MRGLSETTAIVTGAGGAIGCAIARRFGDAGAKVAVFDLNEDAANDTVAQMSDGRFVAAAVDITDHAGTRSAVDRVETELGPVDVLVNCAGWDKLCPFLDSEPELWDRLIDVNYRGALNMHHAVLGKMVERGRGRIVTIASDAGRVGSSGEAVYAGCKGALIAFSKSIAREVARNGITVNVVCPGPTKTPLLESFLDEGDYGQKVYNALERAIPMRRLGQPDDIAGMVAFLASDDAAFITGQVISISGGLTMHG